MENMENMDLNKIVDRLLNMKPDPIPEFVLLKEFKGCPPDSKEYKEAYKKVCIHPFVKKYEDSQNDRGFWPPFHGYTEGIIRLLLSYGLDKNHNCLKKVKKTLLKALDNKENWDQSEKQDNIRWWPEMFIPLVDAAMLSLIDKNNVNLDKHRKRWANFAENSLSNGTYDLNVDSKQQNEHFGFITKRIIPPFNYYNLLLLSPNVGINYINDSTDQSLVDYCIKKSEGIYYVYNNCPGDFVTLEAKNRDSRDFWNWIRALSLISQFNGWSKYEQKYFDWILKQKNNDGLWEFPRKFDFAISNSWKGKNKIIDSTIYVLRLLSKKKAF
jgi:hypothetical protein